MQEKLRHEISHRIVHGLLGVCPSALGIFRCEHALLERMRSLGFLDPREYEERLKSDSAERQQLIELLVVSESWFSRENGAFRAIVKYHRQRQQEQSGPLKVRILSAPCARGEEPYSVAIHCLEAGVALETTDILGVDVSDDALEHAERGIYRPGSFRGTSDSFRERHFDAVGAGLFRVKDSLRKSIQFRHENVSQPDLSFLGAFDIILCRNLLIYLTPENQQRLITALFDLLVEGGLFIVAAAEAPLVCHPFAQSRPFDIPVAFRRNSASKPMPVTPSENARGFCHVEPRTSGKRRPVRNPRVPSGERMPGAADKSSTKNIEDVRRLADRGDYRGAIAVAEELLAGCGLDAELHALLGTLFHALDDDRRAEAHFRRAIFLKPEHEEALLSLALLVEDSEEHDRLLLRARRVLSRERCDI